MRNGTIPIIIILTLSVWAGTSHADPINPTKLVDLTYAFDDQTVAWPGNLPFHRKETASGPAPGGYWYTSGQFSTAEHAGTHMDAPIHFAKGQLPVDEIPVSALAGPAVVIDVREQAKADRDYRLTPDDISAWEAKHGRIPAGAIVVMFTGWGRYWSRPEEYLGSTTLQDTATLHFPGFSREAAELLVQSHEIRGIGIDTASIDYGPSQDFIVHQIINGAGLYGLENVANLDQLPPKDATIIALPIKIKGGTGGPTRIIAIVP